jgi:hypothetical protein
MPSTGHLSMPGRRSCSPACAGLGTGAHHPVCRSPSVELLPFAARHPSAHRERRGRWFLCVCRDESSEEQDQGAEAERQRDDSDDCYSLVAVAGLLIRSAGTGLPGRSTLHEVVPGVGHADNDTGQLIPAEPRITLPSSRSERRVDRPSPPRHDPSSICSGSVSVCRRSGDLDLDADDRLQLTVDELRRRVGHRRAAQTGADQLALKRPIAPRPGKLKAWLTRA